MTNYAEGYPNKRYYEGCQNVDITEQLAIEKELFQAEQSMCNLILVLKQIWEFNYQKHDFSLLKTGDSGDLVPRFFNCLSLSYNTVFAKINKLI